MDNQVMALFIFIFIIFKAALGYKPSLLTNNVRSVLKAWSIIAEQSKIKSV